MKFAKPSVDNVTYLLGLDCPQVLDAITGFPKAALIKSGIHRTGRPAES